MEGALTPLTLPSLFLRPQQQAAAPLTLGRGLAGRLWSAHWGLAAAWGSCPTAACAGCACRSAAGAGRSAASRALQAAGACASGPCGRQLMRSAPAAALWRHRGPSRRRRVRSSRARFRRGGPAVVLSHGSEHTHGHTQVRVLSILGLGLGKFGDFMMRSEICIPLLLIAY